MDVSSNKMRAMRPEIDRLATDLGVGDWTRRKWRQRGAVPHRWRLALIEAGRKEGVKLVPKDMEWKVPQPRRQRAS